MAGTDRAADLTHVLAGVVCERIGLKPALSIPKIEAFLRGLPAGEQATACRDLIASADTRAWRGFAETLLVHETYFFRHPDQLRLLADVLLPAALAAAHAGGRRQLRVWCAGCSSGEEVYTLALLVQAALGARPPGETWDALVVGSDLSPPTLDQARAGHYALLAGLNSFRDVPEFARHHFTDIFTATSTSWSAGPELRRLTRFQPHNLVSEPPPLRDADLVLCRNTLIYFDDAQQRAALATLEAALRPGGALLLGPAESAEASGLRMVASEQAVHWSKPA